MLRRLTSGIQDAWDSYLSAVYYPVVCLLFLLVVVFIGWYGERLAKDWEEWTITEWLISYAPGFVRRGLIGEALLFISRHSGWPANQVAYGTFVFLFALFFVLFAALLHRKQMTFWYFALCLSPGFVLFAFYNRAAIGRKEYLIFVVFTMWALWSAGRRKGLGFHLAFGVLCFLITLMHEMFFFFSQYFVLLSYLVARREGGRPEWRASLIVPACSGVALLLVSQFSASLNDPALCARLIRLGAPTNACSGVLDYSHFPPIEAITYFIEHFDTQALLGIGLIFAVVLIPLGLFLLANADEATSTVRLMGMEAIVILFSIPLFVLAVDWGRWISIHVVLLTIACSVFLSEKGLARGTRKASGRMSAAFLAAGLLVLLSMLTWSVNYCCGGSVVKAFGPVEALRRTWGEFKL